MYNQIKENLSSLPLLELTKLTKFSQHKDVEIDAMTYLLSFFAMVSKGKNTLRQWTLELSFIVGRPLSQSAIRSKLHHKHLIFVKELFKQVLGKQQRQGVESKLKSNLLKRFKNCYIEDSTCVQLPQCLASDFPGPSNRYGTYAMSRIQLRLEILSEQVVDVVLQNFRDNDQKHSSNVLGVLEAGDLILRDMGYAVLKVFKKITEKGAFYLSRLPANVKLFAEEDDKESINLVAELMKKSTKGQTKIRLEVYAGRKDREKTYLIAVKLSDDIAQMRRAKAKKNRNKKANHSDEYYELLGWALFITNTEPDVWSVEEIVKVYRLRWRIEIVFKAWKSELNFAKFFTQKASLTVNRAKITLYLLLIWIIYCFAPLLQVFSFRVWREKGKMLSIRKFAHFFVSHLMTGSSSSLEIDNLIDIIAKHCCYESRVDRENYLQQLIL